MGITSRFFPKSHILKLKNTENYEPGPGVTSTTIVWANWQADRRPLLTVAIFLLILRTLNERSHLNFEKYEFPKRQI